ncbi:tail-specific protease [bacterium]|nr:tail-specific protease [bacterium]
MKPMKTPFLIFVFLLLFGIAPSVSWGDNLECEYIPKILELFLKNHYQHRKLTEELKTRTTDQFVKRMDPSKTMFLESDLPEVKKQLIKAFELSEKGDCSSLATVKELWHQRALESEKIVKEILEANYALNEQAELVVDSKKRTFPKNLDDKKKLLRKMVDFQIVNLLISKVKLPEAKKQLGHRYKLVAKRIQEQKPTETISHFIDAFSNSLDPHSNFMGPDELKDFQIQMRLSLEGIGAVLRYQDGFTVVESLVKGGSADKAKLLKSKDKIIAVAQETGEPVSTIDMDLRDVVKLIRGKKGTKVTLTIMRQGKETKTFQVTLVRDQIALVDQKAKLTFSQQTVGGKSYKIGVLDLPSFYGTGSKGGLSCSEDVEALLKQAIEAKVDGVVLNLSRNGGGLLEEAVKIAGLFIQKGNSVATKNNSMRVDVLKDDEPKIVYKGPLAVLTSRVSASASEILAGALKNYKRAVIIGADHTFGKGSVQTLSDLPAGLGGMKVTTAMFFIPEGKSTQLQGVASDVVLPSMLNNDEIGEKGLDYALQPQTISGFVSKDANSSDPARYWAPVTPEKLVQVQKNSEQRVAQESKFLEIIKRKEKNKKDNGIVRIADIQKENLEQEKKKQKNKKPTANTSDDEEDKAEDGELWDEKGPFVSEATRVLIDLMNIKMNCELRQGEKATVCTRGGPMTFFWDKNLKKCVLYQNLGNCSPRGPFESQVECELAIASGQCE